MRSTSACGAMRCARVEAEGDREQNDHAGRDDAGLEAAARPEIAVELDVQREQQDERQDELGADAKDEIEAHVELSLLVGAPPARAPRRSSITPIPAVKITVVSPSVS